MRRLLCGMAALLTLTACGTMQQRTAPAAQPTVQYVQMAGAQAGTYQPPPVVANGPRPLPMGDWSVERGQQIADRALKWLGTPYAWAGGTAIGPSRGVPVDYASRNDGKVIGFDCSGLVIYAVAPWRRLTHFAATQYTEAGRFHPALNSLWPGDLVFWTTDGTIQKIHHVAIYIGNGNVVHAPQSGDVVRITPLSAVRNETMGATRPLT